MIPAGSADEGDQFDFRVEDTMIHAINEFISHPYQLEPLCGVKGLKTISGGVVYWLNHLEEAKDRKLCPNCHKELLVIERDCILTTAKA